MSHGSVRLSNHLQFYVAKTSSSGLMDRDDWSNLGLNGVRGAAESSNSVVKDNPKDKPNV